MKTAEKIKIKGIVKYVYKKTGKAINDYNMIVDGDRILLAFSGGTDSVSLLKVLLMRRRVIPIDFEVAACFIKSKFHLKDQRGLLQYLEDVPARDRCREWPDDVSSIYRHQAGFPA